MTPTPLHRHLPSTTRRLLATLPLVAPLLLALASPAQAATLKLRLLETTDLHMALQAFDYYADKPTDEYGLARTATLIAAARAEQPNAMLFDNGDLIQGNPLGDQVARVQPLKAGQVHPAMKVLNALKVDAANVGNHEFNFGLDFLQRAYSGAAYPIVNANLVRPQAGVPEAQLKPLFQPYVILERRFTDDSGATRTVKVGVIGFAPPQVLVWDRSHLLGQVQALDIVQTAQRLVPEMRAKGADVVVAIPHSGLEWGVSSALFAENVVARLAQVPGVDAILFGHSHGEFPGTFFGKHPAVDLARGTIHGVPAVMAGAWGSHLGVVDLVLDDSSGGWKVKEGRSHLRPVYDRATRKALVQPDPAINALVAEEHAATVKQMSAEVTRTTAPITSYFALARDDASVQVVAEAQRAHAQKLLKGTPHEGLPLLSAAAPFKAGGRMGANYYSDVPTGPLALRDVASLYVYPNTLKAVKLTGAQVREWLEMSAGQFNRIAPDGPAEQPLVNEAFRTYNFDVIEGLQYELDLTQPARYDGNGKLQAPQARRVVNVRHNGQALDDTAHFIVVTNNYRASGGGSFPGLDGSQIVLDTQDETRVVLAEYLSAQKTYTPQTDGNWRVRPVPGVKLWFDTGAGALPYQAATPQARLMKALDNGFARFELLP
jgi:2',3'-cyclic-nucleotide 2'-phosphodiesterase/3'-nucleotidase